MGFLEKQAQAKQLLSSKHDWVFRRHGKLVMLDASLSGEARFMQGWDGTQVVLGNSIPSFVASCSAGHTSIFVTTTSATKFPIGLYRIKAQESYHELINVVSVEPLYQLNQVRLNLSSPVRNTFESTRFDYVGFFIDQTAELKAGTTRFFCDSASLIVPGDVIQVCNTIVEDVGQEQGSILNNTTISVYGETTVLSCIQHSKDAVSRYELVTTPLLYDVTYDTKLFVQATPAYRSEKLNVEPSAFYFDMFYMNDMETSSFNEPFFNVEFYNVIDELVETKQIKANQHLRFGDHVWFDGFIQSNQEKLVTSTLSARLTLDENGMGSIGYRFPSPMKLMLKFKLDSSKEFLAMVSGDSYSQKASSHNNGSARLDLLYAPNTEQAAVFLDVKGEPNQIIEITSYDVADTKSVTKKIVYTARFPTNDPTKKLEMTGALLKPVFLRKEPTSIGSAKLDAGFVL